MRWLRSGPAIGAVVVLIAAGIIYPLTIPVHHIDRSRLSLLVSVQPGAGFKSKPTSSDEVAASSNPFTTVQAAAKRSPNSTGSYSAEWSGSSANVMASLLVSLLPTTADVAATSTQASSMFAAAASFKSDSLGLLSHFSVPGISGATGAIFSPTAKSKTTKPAIGVAVFSVGPFVAVVFVQQTDASSARSGAVAVAQAESTRLHQLGTGFSLSVTHWPLLATLLYAGTSVGVAAAVVLVPLFVRWARRRRRHAREVVARQALRGRGSKIVKRQAPQSR